MVWAATAVVAATAVYSGVSSYQAGKKTQKLQEAQGQLQLEEGLREATRVRSEGYKFQQEQMMQFISSGVEVKGTPLLVYADTAKQVEEEAAATEKRGYALKDFASMQGEIAANQGRAALIASLGNAVGSGATTYKALK